VVRAEAGLAAVAFDEPGNERLLRFVDRGDHPG
jgi:hypothetical protein